MTTQTVTEASQRTAFRGTRVLVACYAALSLLTLVAIIVLRDHHTLVTDAVWVRGTIVAVSSVVTLLFADRAARGSRRAYLRLRIISAVIVVAIVVIVALPGVFPVWLRIEQGVCGLLLLGVVVLVNGRHIRSSFA